MKLFGLKKTEVSIDEDVLFETEAGRLNASDMVEKIKDLKKECEDKEKEIASKEDECKGLRDKVAELEEKAKKEDKDDDEDDDKKSKENEDASHEPSNKLNEAAKKALEDNAGADHIQQAVKENSQPNVAKVTVRSGFCVKK